MKLNGQSHGGSVHGRIHHNNNNNNNYNNSNSNNNNNNTTASGASMKEAERRLSVILKAAKKMSFTADDLSRLSAVKRLTAAGNNGRWTSWLKHILPVVAGLIALLVVYALVQYSMDDQKFGCLQNTSEAVVVMKATAATASAESATATASSVPPTTPQIMTAPRVPEEIRTRRDLTRGGDDRGAAHTRRWVAEAAATNGQQTLRKER